jgi:uncharacterized protein (TIGR03083 family)
VALFTIAEYRALFQAESEALLADLDRLTDEDWRRQSPCEAWDVLGVVVHLLHGAWVHNRMVESGLAGAVQPSFDVPEGVTPRDYFQQLHRDDHARGPAPNLALLRERLPAYLSTLERVTDADLEKPAWFYGLPGTTLRTMITAWVNDVIIHASDIRRPVGIEPPFSEGGARFVGWAGLPFLSLFVTAERLGGATGIVRHIIDGEMSAVELGESGIRFIESPEPSLAADATITTDGATWALLMWRSLPIAQAEASGALKIEGDRALAERYLGAIKTA